MVFGIGSKRIIIEDKWKWDQRLHLNSSVPRIEVLPSYASPQNLALHPFEESRQNPGEDESIIKLGKAHSISLSLPLSKSISDPVTGIDSYTSDKQKSSGKRLHHTN